jgi:ATP-dependent DNA helicase PIF1
MKLQRFDGEDIGWIAAYERCKMDGHDHDDDPLTTEEDLENESDAVEEELEDEDEIEKEREMRDFHVLAAMGPRPRQAPCRLEKRDIDTDQNWHSSYDIFGGEDQVKMAMNFIDDEKRHAPTISVDETPEVDISKLVGNQRRVFLKVVSHYWEMLDQQDPPPLRLHIDRTAGTGKSYLIWAITKALTQIANEQGKESPVIRIAPTGIAAFNIHGTTIHQAFSLPKSGLPKLDPQYLLQLQTRLRHCKYIILDEKSMVGRRLSMRLDTRLRSAYPDKQDEPFGGSSIMMFGDFGQLAPVGDIPLFDLHLRDGHSDRVIEGNKGRAAYMSLTESITLDRILRQQGDSPEAIRFREVLSNLKSIEATEHDH